MGYMGKLEMKLKARSLRKKGFSVKDIQKKLGVSRSSASLWVRDIQLSKKQQERLYLNKKTGALRGSIIGAKKKQKEREELTRKLLAEREKEVGDVSSRDRFIAGIALYFAEGDKADGHVSFNNSDPKAIRFMANWLREFCNISEEKLRGSLYIHDDLDEKKAKKYWSKLLKIPIAQFGKTYWKKRGTNKIYRKNEAGICFVRYNSLALKEEVMYYAHNTADHLLNKANEKDL